MSDYLQKIKVSSHPTEFFYIKRIVNKKYLQNLANIQQFKTYMNGELMEVYINPNVLSYSIIDNIINLDFYFNQFNELKLKFGKNKICKQNQIYQTFIRGDTDILLDLHKLNLYQCKYEGENNYRGGCRFIFKSQTLANQLYFSLVNQLPQQLSINFCKINQIFRFNFFTPQDSKFQEHYDIPYVNKIKQQESKFTLLIYLTPGKNYPALQFDQFQFNQILPNQCIIFDQKLKHSGNPYLYGNKIFIRTQLIYNKKYNYYSQEAATLFNTACYMSKQAILNQDLVNYSKECFTNHIKIRNLLQKIKNMQKLYLHKHSQIYFNNQKPENLQFITDGTNFYFSKNIDIFLCVGIVIYDYFSGPGTNKIVDKYYLDQQDQSQLFSEILYKQFQEYCNKDRTNIQFFNDRKLVIRQQSFPKFAYRLDQYCCNQTHRKIKMQPFIKQIINGFYYAFDQFENPEASFIILGDNYVFNLNDAIFLGDKIYFKNSNSFSNFNFAGDQCSCSEFTYQEFLTDYQPRNTSYQAYSLPYISYKLKNNLHILNIDMFHNGYTVVKSENKSEMKLNDLVKFIKE